MVTPRSVAARTTVYRLMGLTSLANGLRPKYIDSDQFVLEEIQVDGRAAVLLVGAMAREQAPWAPRLESISGVSLDVGNKTAAAALLIKAREDTNGSGTAWGLTYGMGFQLLEQEYVDSGFGQRVAIRTADPESLRSLTRTTLDHRARTDRSSIPAGEQLRGFGIGDFGEVVSRVVASAVIPPLTVGSASITIRGSDALSVPLAKDPSSLIRDLEALDAVLRQPALAEFEVLEQLTPVKSPARIEELHGHLRYALQGESSGRIAIGWPHERVDETGAASSYKFIGAGREWGGPFDDVPTLEHLRTVLQEKDPSDPVEAAKTVRIQLYRDADAEEAISGAVSALKWLAYEVSVGGSRYCLHDGRWYQMDTDYATRLHQRVQDIFARGPYVGLPEWPGHVAEENEYNEFAAGRLGAVVLDRSMIRTQLHRRGIEPCDLVTKDGVPVHVKRLDRSSAASHLFAQALVSVDALRYDEEARMHMRTKLEAAGSDPDLLGDRPSSVVLGVASTNPLDADSLFTFTQVTLARLDAALAAAGINVIVEPILRETQ